MKDFTSLEILLSRSRKEASHSVRHIQLVTQITNTSLRVILDSRGGTFCRQRLAAARRGDWVLPDVTQNPNSVAANDLTDV